MTRREIVEVFDRLEREAGGVFLADQKDVLRRTAEALGIPYERAREVMIDHWGMGFSG